MDINILNLRIELNTNKADIIMQMVRRLKFKCTNKRN